MKVLQKPIETDAGKKPFWVARPESAISRVRGCIENMLSSAKARGLRTGENPAQWRGHLADLLPARAKIAAVAHYSAMPYRDVPAFMAKLRPTTVCPHAVLSSSFDCGAKRRGNSCHFAEIGLDEAAWANPGERMKKRPRA